MHESWSPPPRIIPADERADGEPSTGGYFYYCAVLKLGRPELVSEYLAALDATRPGERARMLEAAATEDRPFGRGTFDLYGVFTGIYHSKAIAAAIDALLEDFHARARVGEIEGFGSPEQADGTPGPRERLPPRLFLSPTTSGLEFAGVMLKRFERPLYSEPVFYLRAAAEPHAKWREPVFRGGKAMVWEAIKRRGRPDLSTHGAVERFVELIAAETKVRPQTVRNYVTKQSELRAYIEQLP